MLEGEEARSGRWTNFETVVLLESTQKVIDGIDNLAMLDGEQLQRIFELYNEVVTYMLCKGGKYAATKEKNTCDASLIILSVNRNYVYCALSNN